MWAAPTTTDRDRKQLLHTLLDEVNITVERDHASGQGRLVLRWKGGATTDIDVAIKRKPPKILRTNEDTVELARRLAAHYPDATIAGILNREGRRSARGLTFTGGRVQGLRHHSQIPRYRPDDNGEEPHGQLLTIADAAKGGYDLAGRFEWTVMPIILM